MQHDNVTAERNRICSICGGIENVDTRTILWKAETSWKVFYMVGPEKHRTMGKQEFREKRELIEWEIGLCRECELSEYEEANASKVKNIDKKMSDFAAFGVAGTVIGGIAYLVGIPTQRAASPGQLDVKATNSIGAIAWTILLLIGVVALMFLLSIPVLVLMRIYRKRLIRNVKMTHHVPLRAKALPYLYIAERILSAAENKTAEVFHGHYPIPDKPSIPSERYHKKFKKAEQVSYNLTEFKRKPYVRKVSA